MASFCPEWVFGVCAAKTSYDFLSTNSSVNMIAKKFSSGLSEHYNEIKFEEIVIIISEVTIETITSDTL